LPGLPGLPALAALRRIAGFNFEIGFSIVEDLRAI
jgi:hypothetical protein